MVHKNFKAGLHTGNTIRLAKGHHLLHKYQKYSYFLADAPDMTPYQKRKFRDLLQFIPTTNGNVEYSMNKKRRWELPSLIKSTFVAESDNPEVPMVVMEHTQRIGQLDDEYTRSCTSFASNIGQRLEKVSLTDMNMKSAGQTYNPTDHLTKRERKHLKEAGLFNMIQNQENLSNISSDSEFPVSTFHIMHGACPNGRLYKDLTTKGVLVARRSTRFTYGKSSKLNNYVDILSINDCSSNFNKEDQLHDDSTDAQYTKSNKPAPMSCIDILSECDEESIDEPRLMSPIYLEEYIEKALKVTRAEPQKPTTRKREK